MPAWSAATSPGLINSLPSCSSVSLLSPLSEATGAAQNYFSVPVTEHKMHRALSSQKLQLKLLWAIQRSSQLKSSILIPPPGVWSCSQTSGMCHVSGRQMYLMGKQIPEQHGTPCTLLSVQHVLPDRKTFPRGFISPCELSVLNSFTRTIVLWFSPPPYKTIYNRWLLKHPGFLLLCFYCVFN